MKAFELLLSVYMEQNNVFLLTYIFVLLLKTEYVLLLTVYKFQMENMYQLLTTGHVKINQVNFYVFTIACTCFNHLQYFK